MPESMLFTGEQVRAARAIARIDQNGLAERSGVSLETIKRIEGIHGVAEVNSRTYSAILGAFGRLGVEFESYDGAAFGVRKSVLGGPGPEVSEPPLRPAVPITGPMRRDPPASEPPSRAAGRGPGVPQQASGQASTMIAYWDHTLRCRFANGGYLEWFGRDPTEMIGLSMSEVLGARIVAASEVFIRSVMAGEPQTFERSVTKPDGAVGHTLVQYTPDLNPAGRVVGFRAVTTDVTVLKEAELRLAGAKATFEQARRQADAVLKLSSQTLAALTCGMTGPWVAAAT
jgi:PAS domain S-box-containing protein